MKTANKLPEEQMISTIHKALDQYIVPIWNGEAKPIDRPLKEGLTSMSYDVKLLKGQMEENNKILKNTKERKKVVEQFENAIKQTRTWIKATTFGRLMIYGIGFVIFIKGAFSAYDFLSDVIGKLLK